MGRIEAAGNSAQPSRPLRVLIVEDVEQDAVLLVRELNRGGFEVTSERVDTHAAMKEALTRQPWDIVISDYAMPHFSAPHALRMVQELLLDLPFIIVSGTVGEDTAIESIHAGAHDFMIKGRLARLIPAIERELRDAALRTERRKMEQQLLIADRMASVGVLAAGVAHEINNPLATLMANLSYATEQLSGLRQEMPGADAARLEARVAEIEEPLRDAVEALDRVRLIVRDLKVFSRTDDTAPSAVDVHRVMESSLRLGSTELRHRAKVICDYGEVPLVSANEGKLGQIFLNLLVNAAQAMPEGRVARNELHIMTRRDRDEVVIEVRDTGTGIPPEILPRIFDPFFTTKPVGVGTGLGLAICHRLVGAMNGHLSVESELGKGSLFRVTLRVAGPAELTPMSSRPAPAPIPSGPKRRGRVLVVDDEPMLSNVLKRMLMKEHEVTVVFSSEEALELLSRGERYDVIMSDLMMPEMTGMDLFAEVRRLDPPQAERMVFMTGGAFTPLARDFLENVPNHRLEKPFEMADVRALVHTLVG